MTPPPSPEEAGRLALRKLEAVLEAKPEKDDHALTEATNNLCILRDALIPAARAGGAAERDRLARVNSILSVVAATHFPIGPVPWEPLAGARGALAELLGEGPAAS